MTTSHQKLSENAWTALTEALSCYHWYKRPFENLVRGRFADAPELLSRLNFQGVETSHRLTLGQPASC